ncbi:MAG: cation-translocating P-type ATPase [Pseudomonadota bacterium]
MTPAHHNTGQGLSTVEASSRLAQQGPNEIAPSIRRSVWQRLVDMLRQPMFALLVAAAVLYVLLGDLTEGLTLAVFVLAVLVLSFYQEGQSEAAIDALRQLTQPQARVLRDGQTQLIPARDVVVGDWLLLSEGDRVAADGWLLAANNLQIDESLLTGESVPVDKTPPAMPPGSAPSDLEEQAKSAAFVQGGTFVVRGSGRAQVSATGLRSQIGQIGQALAQVQQTETPLQRQTARLVQVLASLVGVLCVVMVMTLGLRTGEWLPALLAGIALAMAILPEEYSVVLTLFPAMGARRLTREGVLTRHINAIETLGATSVLCTDKTGTLTQNRMTVTALSVPRRSSPAEPGDILHWSADVPKDATPQAASLSAPFHPLIEHAILASAPTPFDPMETAFHAMGQSHLNDDDRQFGLGQLVQSYALSPSLKAMSHVWQFEQEEDRIVSAKGAPEAIMDLCHLNDGERQRWLACVTQMAQQGLRVLAVAHSRFEGDHYPDSPHDFAFEWLGLIGLTDPLRAEIPQAVAHCQSAGIQVIMITGDYPVTARTIARQAGLPEGDMLTGEDLDHLSDAALQQRLPQVTVCARISPHQKLRIVQALQARGEVVAMTGDGVNDAPALKAAHVGIAMGARGTDVAREAADLVLVDDNFASIVRGIRLGRRIFGNLQKSMQYIFAIHIPIAGIALIPLLMDWPALMLPLHVALLELVIDPACSLAFESEPEEADVMQRPPRDTQAPLFGAQAIGLAMGQGLCVLASVALTYVLANIWSGAWAPDGAALWTAHLPAIALSEAHIRAMVFITLITGNAALILSNRAGGGRFWRSWRSPNRMAYAVIGLAGVLLALAIEWPWLSVPLKFESLPLWPTLLAIGSGLLSGVSVSVLHWAAAAWQARPRA